jgi:hypothetical protein
MSFPRKKAPLPVVLIRWNDASSCDVTFDDSEKKKEHHPELMVSVGFLICEDKQGYTIVTDVQLPEEEGDEFTYRVRHFFPKGMVHDITVLRK